MAEKTTRDVTNQVVSRTQDTEEQYRKKGVELRRLAREETDSADLDLLGCLDWYCEQHRKYAPASLRFNKQAWLRAIDDAVMAGEISRSNAEELRSKLVTSPPRPKGRHDVKETSTKKTKDAQQSEIVSVTRFLKRKVKANDRDRAAAILLGVNTILGLRPIEWRDAVLRGDTLLVRSAKLTNGRGLVTVRRIRLIGWNRDLYDRLNTLLRHLKPWASRSKEEFLAEMDRLRQRIAHACRKTGVRRLCPYGTRHTCIATLRRLGVDLAEIAAQVGHGTTRTQTRHYARARSGLPLKAVLTRPADPAVVDMVRKHEGFSLENFRYPRTSAPRMG
jgi:integrase